MNPDGTASLAIQLEDMIGDAILTRILPMGSSCDWRVRVWAVNWLLGIDRSQASIVMLLWRPVSDEAHEILEYALDEAHAEEAFLADGPPYCYARG